MKVTVLMAAYNSNASFLKESIESIINQTFSDFEFVIVDDGSIEPLEPIIRQISNDKRIVVYRKENTGLGSSLTYGISKARGEYIARIDDDDVSVRDRLEKQVEFLDSHPYVSCVGGHIYLRYNNKYIQYRKFPLTHEEIIKRLFTMHFSMAHTCLMYRKRMVEEVGCYRISKGNEDLDLLLQLGTVGNLANIDKYLTFYRLSNTGLSVASPQKKEAYSFALRGALKYEGYRKYTKKIIDSIALLESGEKKNIFGKLNLSYRKILIMVTKYFGNRIMNQQIHS